MEDNRCYDPLLLTDVNLQSVTKSVQFSFPISTMDDDPNDFSCETQRLEPMDIRHDNYPLGDDNENYDFSCETQRLEPMDIRHDNYSLGDDNENDDFSCEIQRLEPVPIHTRSISYPLGDDNESDDFSCENQRLELMPVHTSYIDGNQSISYPPGGDNGNDGRSMFGFSLTTPDLVLCAGSPDVSEAMNNDCWKHIKSPTEISLEKGINGFEDIHDIEITDNPNLLKKSVSVNAGFTDGATALSGTNYSEDSSFDGGDTIGTDAIIGDGEALPLYQTARFGNFSYVFQSMESGNYAVELHFAEIIFTNGPPGMRVFDVYLQEQKVVSSLDIYSRVGGNKPLVISDLKTWVDEDGILTVRFEGVYGSAIVCGISIKEDSINSTEEMDSFKFMGMSHTQDIESSEDRGDSNVEGDFYELQSENEFQKKELAELKRTLEELNTENQLKTRECQEAWKSLKELQNELMRKSMHVGSLAFAIEGQVKEKSRWFSSLTDLTTKLKNLKMEHLKLIDEASTFANGLAYIDEMSSGIHSKVTHQAQLYEDLKIKYLEGAKERKELYNKFLDLKGNIRVFCRCRPLNTEEIDSGSTSVVDFELAKDGEITVKSNGSVKKTFKFDAVFTPQADQVDVFKDTAPVATSVLDGYNVCIFAYGQSGTGKTFTMQGTKDNRGVNFRTLEELFCIIKERQMLVRYDVSVSVLEVYNEQIRDLLDTGTQPDSGTKRLEIKQVGEGIHCVPGLVEARVNNFSEVWDVLQTGSGARAVSSTSVNEQSSRSHCMHCVTVKGENLLNGECTRSKLWLVDLAGSERIAKSEVQGDRLKETQNINKSLSALGDVIAALATKSAHIPFRNSKLTHLLQDSLGGNSKTLMFVQISPSDKDMTETLCSLNFASRVRGIELGPAKKQLDTTEFLKYKHMVEKTKQDAKIKDIQLKKMEETIQGLDLKLKGKDHKNKMLQDKVRELESQLLIERKLARQHVVTKIAEQHMKQQQQQQQHQQEEQTSMPTRPPLASRPLGLLKKFNESNVSTPLMKDQGNLPRILTENISYHNTTSLVPTPAKYIDHQTEKENNPDIAEQLQHIMPQKKTGRASICTTVMPVPLIPEALSRRYSLIPFPNNAPSTPNFPSTLQQLTPHETEKKDDGAELTRYVPEPSPKVGTKGKKLSSASLLRRSMQKKVQIKSPLFHTQSTRRSILLNQSARRGSVLNPGMSTGTKGRMARRVLPSSSNYKKTAIKDDAQQQIFGEKDKERAWKTGTAGRIFL